MHCIDRNCSFKTADRQRFKVVKLNQK